MGVCSLQCKVCNWRAVRGEPGELLSRIKKKQQYKSITQIFLVKSTLCVYFFEIQTRSCRYTENKRLPFAYNILHSQHIYFTHIITSP